MTLKKAIMVGLVCAVLTTLGATAYAGWGGCCGFFFFGSVDTELTVKGGSSGDAFVTWTITPKEYEFLCINPANNTASTTVMLRELTLSTLEPVDQDTGRKGKPKTVTGTIGTAVLGDDDNDCVNPNWHAQNGEFCAPGDGCIGEDLNEDGVPDEMDTVFVRLFDATAEIITIDPKTGTKSEFLATYTGCSLNGNFSAQLLPPEGTMYENCEEDIVKK